MLIINIHRATNMKLIEMNNKKFRFYFGRLINRLNKTASAIAIFALVFSLLPPLFVSASSTQIFLDDFNQNGFALANKWENFSGASSPERRIITNDGFIVGVSGTKGFLFRGGQSSNPDDGAEREIATKGYASLSIEYSRSIGGFESGDQFVAQYSFDGGSFVTLETLTANQSHSVVVFTVPNPDRHTKLTVRFFVNGNAANDKAGVDNLKIFGDNPPLFYDGFESNNFSSGGWLTFESPSFVTANNKIWTDDNDSANGHAVRFNGNNSINPDDAIVKHFDSSGWENIRLRYARKADNMQTNENFKALYSIDNGINWTLLEAVENTPYSSVLFGPLPSSANNNPNLEFRFEINANNSEDNVYIDDVVIWGDERRPGSITIVKNSLPDDPQDFIFSRSFGNNFSLDDDSDSELSNQLTFADLDAGSYAIIESGVSGWQLTDIICSDPDNGTNINLETGGAAIDLDAGENIICAFTNTKLGLIIVDKVTAPSGDPQKFTFAPNYGDTFELADLSLPNVSAFLAPGSYSVNENVPVGWDLTNSACSNGSNPQNIELNAGETVTCSFTNTKRGLITVTKIADPDAGIFQFNLIGPTAGDAVIDGSGSYTFDNLLPGVYALSEVLPSEWSGVSSVSCSSDISPDNINLGPGESVNCIFNNTAFGSISGKKFHDFNADTEDSGDDGLGGWIINLIKDNENIIPVETDPNGFYTFGNLLPGVYQICEETREGWLQSLPQEGFGCENDNQGYVMELLAGQNITNIDFGNYRYGSIQGRKFNDLNGNGSWEENEPNLAGWTIELYNNNGESEELLFSQITNEHGYVFSGLKPGTYFAREIVLEDGWTQTMPEDNADYIVEVLSGDIIGEKDFGNFQEAKFSGYKWNDRNGDGIWQNEGEVIELPLGGWEIKAVSDGAEKISVTGENGYYEFVFSGNETGEWQVQETAQSGWNQVFPPISGVYNIDIVSGFNSQNNNFGNFPQSVITGYKWYDLNIDGFWQKEEENSEPGLENWQVTLHKLGLDGEELIPIEIIALSLTGTDGRFSLNASLPGAYRITEENQDKWQNTYPVDSFFDVFVEFGGLEINQDKNGRPIEFGNVKYEEILDGKLVPISGNATSTLSAVVLEDFIIPVEVPEGESVISIFGGTVISRVDGEPFDISGLTVGPVNFSVLTGFGSGVIIDGALQWGIDNIGLQFSQPFNISIFIGAQLNGQTLNIQRSLDGLSGWTNDGIVPSATCVVSAGLCQFSATKASYYAVTHPIPPEEPSSDDGDDNDNNSAPGNTFGIVTNNASGGVPMPPETPVSEGPSEESVSLPETSSESLENGQVQGPISEDNEEPGEIPDQIIPLELAQGLGVSAPVVSNLPFQSISEEELGVSDEEGSGTTITENINSMETTSGSSEISNRAGLAAAAAILTLGTDSVFIGVIMGIAILAAAVYITYFVGRMAIKRKKTH